MDHAPCYVIGLFPLITTLSFTIRLSARGFIICFVLLAFMAPLQEYDIQIIIIVIMYRIKSEDAMYHHIDQVHT